MFWPTFDRFRTLCFVARKCLDGVDSADGVLNVVVTSDTNVDFETAECLLQAVEQTVDSVYLSPRTIDSLVETEDTHLLKRPTE